MHAGADMCVHLSVCVPGTLGNFGAKNPDPHRVARSNTFLCIQHGTRSVNQGATAAPAIADSALDRFSTTGHCATPCRRAR